MYSYMSLYIMLYMYVSICMGMGEWYRNAITRSSFYYCLYWWMCEVILAGVVQLSSRWIKRATKFHHIFDFAVYFNGFLYGHLAKRRFNFVYILVFSGRERYNVRTMLNTAATLPTTAHILPTYCVARHILLFLLWYHAAVPKLYTYTYTFQPHIPIYTGAHKIMI